MIGARALALSSLGLAAGTLAFRVAGPVVRARLELAPRVERLMTVAVAVLFSAVIASAAVLQGHQLAGVARPAGVVVAGVLAWSRAPFVVVVIAAAATTAALRLAGVP